MTLLSSEFVSRRLHGRVPLARALWWDMLLVGTTVNLVAGALAVVGYLHGAPIWLATIVFLSPLPYNILLATSVWRSAVPLREEPRLFARIAAVGWLALMLVV